MQRSLRSIAPNDMTSVPPYSATCNPPRKAKRPRFEAQPSGHASSSSSPHQPKIAPAAAGHSSPETSPASPARKRTMSRAAREAQRKMNHSLIEKARRTKINEALSTLKALVPPDYHRIDDVDDQDGGVLQSNGKGKKEEKEKEFKLEILERTVGYLQELTERIKVLEQRDDGRCEKCAGSGKRKRTTGDPPRFNSIEDDRLPSISSWLPQVVPVTPSESQPSMSTSPLSQFYLNTPVSTNMVDVHLSRPPPLTLPSPTLRPLSLPRRPTATTAAATAAISPEDESAASMLLQIATSPTLSPSSSASSDDAKVYTRGSIKPQTPGSILGLKL